MSNTVRKKISENVILDKSILNQAGIRNEIDIVVQDGAILILPVVKENAWKVLRSFGEDATAGSLENPSLNHDRYIYGESK